MVNVTGPSASPDVIVFVALQVLPLPEAAAAISPLMVTSGVSIGSEEVKLSVMILPRVALDVSELLDSMDTIFSSGSVVSGAV